MREQEVEEAEEAHHAPIHQYRREPEHRVARVTTIDELLEQIRRLESHSRLVPLICDQCNDMT